MPPEDAAQDGALPRIGLADLRELPAKVLRNVVEPRPADRLLQLLRRIQGDNVDPVLLREEEQVPVGAEVVPPRPVPLRLLQELELRELPRNPPVENRLLRLPEHLHPDGDLPREAAVQLANHGQLDPLVVQVVVRLPHAHQPRAGEHLHHPVDGKPQARGQMEDLLHLRRGGRRIRHLRAPRHRGAVRGAPREEQRQCDRRQNAQAVMAHRFLREVHHRLAGVPGARLLQDHLTCSGGMGSPPAQFSVNPERNAFEGFTPSSFSISACRIRFPRPPVNLP